MNTDLPQLNTLGALMRFVISLETETVDRYTEWATVKNAPVLFSELANEHRLRVERLTRLLREQLNEMILEPISGFSAADYTGPTSSATDLERRLAQLYTDIVAHAGHIFPGANRILTRFAERSRCIYQTNE